MYVPNHFKFNDEKEKVAFMKQYPFATIITMKNNIPIATHLPFYIDDCSEKLVISSHFALANEQVKYIAENTALVIFTEPHAYISPQHYDKPENVPTWNYIAVHAYGNAKILEGEVLKIKLLEQMIQFYEQGYMEQWNALSDKYKKGMLKGIVAFEIEIDELQGKTKLSQNRSETEQQRIIEQLEKSENTTEKDLAEYIKNT